MTPSDHDPFDRLRQLPDPEPDPKKMQTTISESRAAFDRRAASPRARRRSEGWARFRERFNSPSGWLVPVGIGAFGMAAFTALLLSVLTPTTIFDGEAPRVAEAPPIAESQPGGGIRSGAAPSPSFGDGPPLADIDPNSLTVYEEQNIRLGYRLQHGRYSLFMLTAEGALAMDDRAIGADTITILDAVRIPRPLGFPEVIAVQTQAGSAPPVWDAYLGLKRDAELSRVIADAPNAAEAENRIVETLTR